MAKLEEIKANQGYPNRFRIRQWIRALEKRFKKESKELIKDTIDEQEKKLWTILKWSTNT